MGNFYVNFTCKGTTPAAVATALSGREALVVGLADDLVICTEKETSDQDDAQIQQLGIALSKKLSCTVLAALVHDDDILMLWLFRSGQLEDSYDSLPGYWDESLGDVPTGGNAGLIANTFGVSDVAAVEAILRAGNDEDKFASERHADLLEALGLSQEAVGFGFDYVSQGELPDGVEADSIIKTT